MSNACALDLAQQPAVLSTQVCDLSHDRLSKSLNLISNYGLTLLMLRIKLRERFRVSCELLSSFELLLSQGPNFSIGSLKGSSLMSAHLLYVKLKLANRCFEANKTTRTMFHLLLC